MRKGLFFPLSAFALFLMASCQGITNHKNSAADDPLTSDRDTTIRPQDDFFDYANGGWIKSNPIPDEYSSHGVARMVIDDLQNRLRTINEEAVKKPKDAISKKIAAFWQSGMDSSALNQAGIKPILPLLSKVDSAKDLASLILLSAELNQMGIGTLFDNYVTQDDKKSDEMALYLSQGGLGLPDRDYYFNTDAQTAAIRSLYPQHISRMFQLAGLDSVAAGSSAQKILHIETQLAKASRKLEALRDPYANYNKMAISDLKTKLSPNIDWPSWNQAMGVKNIDSVVVGQPEFFKTLSGLLKSVPLQDWKTYMKWHIISDAAPYLSDNFSAENFAFYNQALNGSKRQLPRWKRVLNAEEGAMGEALGQLFVKENFDKKAKQRYENMVEEVRAALKARIQKLDWMSAPTKAKALVKLEKMGKKVGYPEKWKDFSAMDIKEQSYFENIMAARKWWHNYEVNKLGKPVDRDEWHMTPQTYNAYYSPSNNEIVLPAGIFTIPGKMDEELDDAFVYGYAGASTIGHEITHGFDDQGRQYDENGNLNNWWTKEDETRFNERAQVMVRQFNKYEPVKGMFINGNATLGENIADLGGVLLGWDAFTQKAQYKQGKKINGQTPAERYFLGYSYGWLYNMRQEELSKRLLTDVHSPAKYRVNGPFSNVDAFYETFKVQSSDRMFIPDTARVRIW